MPPSPERITMIACRMLLKRGEYFDTVGAVDALLSLIAKAA